MIAIIHLYSLQTTPLNQPSSNGHNHHLSSIQLVIHIVMDFCFVWFPWGYNNTRAFRIAI